MEAFPFVCVCQFLTKKVGSACPCPNLLSQWSQTSSCSVPQRGDLNGRLCIVVNGYLHICITQIKWTFEDSSLTRSWYIKRASWSMIGRRYWNARVSPTSAQSHVWLTMRKSIVEGLSAEHSKTSKGIPTVLRHMVPCSRQHCSKNYIATSRILSRQQRHNQQCDETFGQPILSLSLSTRTCSTL